MTVQQEIQALEDQLSSTTNEHPDSYREQAEIVINILSKYARIRSLKGQQYVERLLELRANMLSLASGECQLS